MSFEIGLDCLGIHTHIVVNCREDIKYERACEYAKKTASLLKNKESGHVNYPASTIGSRVTLSVFPMSPARRPFTQFP